jgi:hypothetical protein
MQLAAGRLAGGRRGVEESDRVRPERVVVAAFPGVASMSHVHPAQPVNDLVTKVRGYGIVDGRS